MAKNGQDSGTRRLDTATDSKNQVGDDRNAELDRRVDEYQMLFDLVPCIIKVASTLGEGSHFAVRMPKVLPEMVKTPQREQS